MRRELLRGLGRLNATTTVLQRARLADPLFGMWEAADVQWWWRPFLPFGKDALYTKYRRYFGEELTPTMELPGALLTGVLTSHGLSFASITQFRDPTVKGHLPKREIARARGIFQ